MAAVSASSGAFGGGGAFGGPFGGRAGCGSGGRKGGAGAGASTATAASQLLGKTKDHEALCVQLLTYARQAEEQLKALWTEHQDLRAESQALLRCLGRKGVLAPGELASELRRNGRSASAGEAKARSPSSSGGFFLNGEDPESRRSPSSTRSAGAGGVALDFDEEDEEEDDDFPDPVEVSSSAATTVFAGRAASSRRLQGLAARGRSMDVRESSAQSSRPADGSKQRGASAHAALSPLPIASRAGRGRTRSPTNADGFSASQPRPAREDRPWRQQQREGGASSPDGRGSLMTRQNRELHELFQVAIDGGGGGASGTTPGQEQRQTAAMSAIQRLLKTQGIPSADEWPAQDAPLTMAVKGGRVDLARMLILSRADANETDSKGVSALHLASFDGHAGLCRILILARADLDAKDRHGQTPLFFAPTREVCKLICDKRADVNVVNHKGQSALHLAARAGLFEVLAWLSMRVHKEFLDLRDCRGYTAKAYAMQANEASEMRNSAAQDASTFGGGVQASPSSSAFSDTHLGFGGGAQPGTAGASGRPQVPRIDLRAAGCSAGSGSPQPAAGGRVAAAPRVQAAGRRSPGPRARPSQAAGGSGLTRNGSSLQQLRNGSGVSSCALSNDLEQLREQLQAQLSPPVPQQPSRVLRTQARSGGAHAVAKAAGRVASGATVDGAADSAAGSLNAVGAGAAAAGSHADAAGGGVAPASPDALAEEDEEEAFADAALESAARLATVAVEATALQLEGLRRHSNAESDLAKSDVFDDVDEVW
eukprot:TRINITY_DN27231_c0_g1_i1.p1 TRINITY_DN27231_c0_g1~~TRINITY_DN27231_c0_g1_i1.p1  ORF type:complete len:811 (-),score=184.10 TRINITY_DN27231_c0_g1_i1:127-2433(-)